MHFHYSILPFYIESTKNYTYSTKLHSASSYDHLINSITLLHYRLYYIIATPPFHIILHIILFKNTPLIIFNLLLKIYFSVFYYYENVQYSTTLAHFPNPNLVCIFPEH